jgi:hypothetical protein
MWEIEPVEVKVSIKDKKQPERIAENTVCKIGLDPCYIIIRQEGVLGESVHEFLYINNSLHKVENTLSPTCEICGRLVVGENNSPYEVSFNTKEEMKNYCDSCIEKYKGWDNYTESKLLFGADSCEDCGKPTNNKVLAGEKIKVQVCEECINGLINIGFEKSIDPASHKSAVPFPVLIKGKSKRKQIYKLKLTKYLTPYINTELPETSLKEFFDESIEQPKKISQQIVKQKMEKEEKNKIKEKRNMKVGLIIIGMSLFLIFFGTKIIDYYSQKELSELRDRIKQEQISPESTQSPPPISPDGDILNSLEASINYLSKPKFSQMISFVRDDGNAVYITIKDSFWYNLTSSQQKQVADRMLDVIYASGDVKRILYLKDEHSRVIAEQHKEKVGVGLTLSPYMDLM